MYAINLVLLAAPVAYVLAAFPNLQFNRRADSWGPAVSLGPSKAEIIHSTTTTYPGAMPANQAGGLFLWPGMSNGTGDLIQSVIGSYSKGNSECSGANADSQWCISSEVFGNDESGRPNQWVGSLRTLLAQPDDGLVFTYNLVDQSKYTWEQTVHNAKTGVLMSSFSKNSGPMLGWGTAVECQSCTPTISTQTYVDTTIILKSADPTFPQTLGAGGGATHSAMTTSDGGKTWYIALMTIPAMNPSGNTGGGGTTPPATGTVAKYGQCGGNGYTGPTVCASGSTCKYSNDWYSQCL